MYFFPSFSVQFASRAMVIKNKPIINEVSYMQQIFLCVIYSIVGGSGVCRGRSLNEEIKGDAKGE